MTLIEQAARRVELAHRLALDPVRWIASPEAARILGACDVLLDLPVSVGEPRSEWGLELVLAAAQR